MTLHAVHPRSSLQTEFPLWSSTCIMQPCSGMKCDDIPDCYCLRGCRTPQNNRIFSRSFWISHIEAAGIHDEIPAWGGVGNMGRHLLQIHCSNLTYVHVSCVATPRAGLSSCIVVLLGVVILVILNQQLMLSHFMQIPFCSCLNATHYNCYVVRDLHPKFWLVDLWRTT